MLGKNKKKKRIKKNDTEFIGESGFTYPFGYTDTDPYIFLGKGKPVRAVFDIVFAYGTNRPDKIGWVNKVIPRYFIESGKVVFIQRQKGIPKETEDKIFQNSLPSNVETMNNSTAKDTREDAKNNSRTADLELAAQLSQSDTIVDSDLMLVVKASTPAKVEEVVKELKLNYKKAEVEGIMIVRRTGEQLQSLKTLFTSIHGDSFHNTDMISVAAGRLFLPSAGFSDQYGVRVGRDVFSFIQNNPAVIDFSNIKNAIIYTGGAHPVVSIDGDEGANFMQFGGSALSHVIADGQYLNGARIHHIVLAKNDYHAGDSLVFDMSKESINPLEVFGTPETVIQDANANFDKVTRMLLMAASAESNPYIKSNLKKQLIEWITYRAKGNGIYSDDPEHNPVKAQKILATDNHKDYPVPADFLLSMNTNLADASNAGPEEKRDAKLMYDTMSTLVSTYPSVFDKTTTLPNVFTADQRNIYYDLSNLGEDPKLLAIVFLNVIAYVTHRALPGETICIDGIDEMELPVEALTAYKKRMKVKEINLITTFESLNKSINPYSYRDFSGYLSDQDMVVLGKITSEDVNTFSDLWQQELPPVVAKQLMGGSDGIFYFYRKKDRLGAVVDVQLIL